MDAHQSFIGRKEHRRAGQLYFAEITVQAHECSGDSQVVLSDDVLNTLREAFAADFEHAQHNVKAAVAAQIATINVGEGCPHAGATTFHAEVIAVRVSGPMDRDLIEFLLSAAGMDAIGKFLTAWELDRMAQLGESPPVWDPETEIDPIPPGPISAELAEMMALADQRFAQLTEEDFEQATYSTVFIMLRADLNNGLSEAEIRTQHPHLFEDSFGPHPDMVREAREDALAGRLMRYKSQPGL